MATVVTGAAGFIGRSLVAAPVTTVAMAASSTAPLR
jgi:uncharacterized protein YbjT (DUF2867 family)